MRKSLVINVLPFILCPSYLNVICGNEKACPADDDEEAAGDVVCDDVVADLALHDHPEAGHGVVTRLLRQVVPLVRQQRLNLDLEKKTKIMIILFKNFQRGTRGFQKAQNRLK